jgi:glycosyltransferase involved in cell wall biosynthesis
MRIAILGTRGIPNNYGGFEQLAENLSLGLVKKGHDVFVYSSSNHDNQEEIWNGIHIYTNMIQNIK